MEHLEDPKDSGGKVPGFTYAWMIPYLAKIGRRHGYAMTFHGSMSRDLDVVAIPWVETANDPKELIDEICRLTGGYFDEHVNSPEKCNKPHGRKAYNILFHGSWHFIDISVMPRHATL